MKDSNQFQRADRLLEAALELPAEARGEFLDRECGNEPELRALLRTSRKLLEGTGVPVGKAFRAGGYLGTPKVLQAIREEGFDMDSSATDYRQLDERKDEVLPRRIKQIWPIKLNVCKFGLFISPQA